MKLFRFLLVVSCAFFFSVASQAQVRFDLGLKGGLNFANLSTSSSIATNYNNRTGYHFGAYAMIKITKFAIQPEILFSRQSQTYAFPSTSNFTANYDYINIPIMIKFYLAAGLNIQAGPQFGFLSNQSKSVTAWNTTTNVTTSQKVSDFVKSSDVSLGLGLGWDLPFGLNLTARYNMGLSDLNKQTGSTLPIQTSLGTKEAKNQVFQFSVGYRLFKIGK
jgi:hypothetical protein